jgi:hypothetical protein
MCTRRRDTEYLVGIDATLLIRDIVSCNRIATHGDQMVSERREELGV